MAITDAYATNQQYKAIIGKSTGDNDSEIDANLVGVSRYLDRRLGRTAGFNKDTTAVARRFYPTSTFQKTLFVDDIASTSGLVVKIDDNQDGTAEITLTQTTDYELMPFNAAVGPETRPYDRLYLPTNRVSRTSWDALVEITALWGWPAVPRAIIDATIQLTAILRIEGPRATSQIVQSMDTVVGASFEAQRIIDNLMRAYARPLPVFA